jgi:hypothetical protein
MNIQDHHASMKLIWRQHVCGNKHYINNDN